MSLEKRLVELYGEIQKQARLGDKRAEQFYNLINDALDNTNYVVKTTVKARAYLATAQDNIVSDAWVTVLLDTEEFDVGNNFNVTTHRFTTPVVGYYMLCGSALFGDGTANVRYGVGIYNVTDAKWETRMFFPVGNQVASFVLAVTDIAYIGAAKALELRVIQYSGSALVDIDVGVHDTHMSIHLLSVD